MNIGDKDAPEVQKPAHPSSNASRKPYVYSSLDEDAQEIRLLTILPGTFDSEIRVTLETRLFNKNSGLSFEALSYAWGSTDNPVDIFLGGLGSQETITVTRNLAEALPYLRYQDKGRVVWIDAICVNQQDMAERGSQVKRMADIYQSASRVIIWLGHESHDSALAIKCCEKLSSNIIADWGLQTMSSVSTDTSWADKNRDLPFNNVESIAICNLLRRDWFTRLWIWQEVNLAGNVVVLCGSQETTWTAVRDAVFSVYHKLKPLGFFEILPLSNLTTLYSLCRGSMIYPLDQLIQKTEHSSCSDPRDRIFALFSLLSRSERSLAIEADYSKSVSRTYQDFVEHYIQNKKHLRILSTIEVRDNIAATPSWVPDWSVPRISRPFEIMEASGISEASAIFKENGRLQVTGLTIGTIELVESFRLPISPSSEKEIHEIASELQRVAKVLNVEGLTDKGSRNLSNFCRVLLVNNFSEVYVPPNPNYSRIKDAEIVLGKMLKRTVDDSEDYSLNDEYLVINDMAGNCRGRSLYKCQDGSIGLAPRGIQLGDKVVVWLGCDTAMALRPLQCGHYLVMGDSFSDRALGNSAFLGSLPEQFELVRRYKEESKHFYWQFYNRETKSFSSEDPRLRKIELPVGWSKAEDDGDIFFVNEETGEKTWFDPRLKAESFKSRGVELEVFKIL
jgi:hypothetical protein